MMTQSAFAQLEKRLDSVIISSIQAGEPGIALYVETKGKTVYKKGFGLANTEVKSIILICLKKRKKLISSRVASSGTAIQLTHCWHSLWKGSLDYHLQNL